MGEFRNKMARGFRCISQYTKFFGICQAAPCYSACIQPPYSCARASGRGHLSRSFYNADWPDLRGTIVFDHRTQSSGAIKRVIKPPPGVSIANEALDIVAAHSLALSFFPPWISRLQKGLGELPTRLVAMNVGEAIHVLREGNCDLMLAYYDPFATMQLDAEVFPSFSIGQVKMLPVSLPDEDGKPLFSIQNDSSIPYLAYTQGAFLGRSVRMLLKNDPLRLKLRTVYETAMAEGLKGMVLQGVGVAWIPDFCIREELKTGKLVRAGDENWDIPLEIRLYRCSLVHKPGVERLWRQMMKLPRDFLQA